MLPDERIGRFGMVETDSLPIDGRMATVALPSQLALMVIVFFVTLNATLRRGLQLRSRMAFQAFDFLMFTDQGKAGLVMVE